MKNKELKQMNRADLIDIIYQYQQRETELIKENTELKAKLNDRTIKIEQSGSIAEAALALSHVFDAAQEAADLYLEQIQKNAMNENAKEM